MDTSLLCFVRVIMCYRHITKEHYEFDMGLKQYNYNLRVLVTVIILCIQLSLTLASIQNRGMLMDCCCL